MTGWSSPSTTRMEHRPLPSMTLIIRRPRGRVRIWNPLVHQIRKVLKIKAFRIFLVFMRVCGVPLFRSSFSYIIHRSAFWNANYRWITDELHTKKAGSAMPPALSCGSLIKVLDVVFCYCDVRLDLAQLFCVAIVDVQLRFDVFDTLFNPGVSYYTFHRSSESSHPTAPKR